MLSGNGIPRVLVVDDSERNVKLVHTLLSKQGYEILVAYDGMQALKTVEQTPPDLILLDVMMPGMDGFEVARILRSNPQNRAIPILMLTALRDLEDKVKGLEAGADDFLVKPFHTVELLARVRSLLRIKQLHDELQSKNSLLEHVLMHYVSREIAQEILRNPEQNLKLGGESCTVSVLFADIRGFTHFSEQREARQVIQVLNQIFNCLTPVVFEHNGTLDKYLGDAIMAIYGVPLTVSESSEQAVRTAWEMQHCFAELQKEIALISELGLGIGVCTGEAVVGNVGSDQFMDYTVIGNIPNMAKRIQEHAGPGQILIDTRTYEDVNSLIEVKEIIPLYGHGFSAPIRAYEVMSVAAPLLAPSADTLKTEAHMVSEAEL